MKLWQKIKFYRKDSLIREYKICGITVFKREKTNNKNIYKVMGIKFSKKRPQQLKINNYTIADLIKYKEGNNKSFYTENINSATIIVPIYNGFDYLAKLTQSLKENTPKSVKIILINDKSTDIRIKDYLKNLEKDNQFIIINNQDNLGFVGSINKSMKMVNTDYAIWLNSDVIVPKYWLERLLFPFNRYRKIATTTPFTNSGCTFSFPVFGRDNPMLFPLEDIDAAFQKINPFDITLNETYSGTGFCMAINMKCWKEIGELDIKNFGKGYGEENDWCLRALQKEWKHLLVPNLFVYHCHGASFTSEEKKKLIEAHQQILIKKYPYEMNVIVPEFFNKDSWKIYRDLASILYGDGKTTIIIDLKKKTKDRSGAIDYQQKLIEEIEKKRNNVVLIQYERKEQNKWSMVLVTINKEREIIFNTFSDIKNLFMLIKIKEVIINNLAYLEDVENTINILCELKEIYNFKMVYKFHDYLSVCPSFFLLNKYGEISSNQNNCTKCLFSNKFRTILKTDIIEWRNSWEKLFLNIDEFNFFSEYTLKIIEKIYPMVKNKFSIIEHKSLFKENYTKYIRPQENEVINIAFVGNFCWEKGGHYFVKLSKLCKNKKIKFMIIGLDNPKLRKNSNVTFVSKYTRDELGDILTKNRIHAVVYSSINSETFSYAAQELMILEVPFVCFNNGAPQERIRKYKYNYAEISNEISAEGLFKSLTKLLKRVYSIDI